MCTVDGVNFFPKRVKFNSQDDPNLNLFQVLAPHAQVAPVSDTSSPKDVSMSVSNENEDLSRTPRHLMRLHHLLDILNKTGDKPIDLTQPLQLANLRELQPELQQVLGQLENEEDIQDLLELAIEHKANVPLITPDALPPSAFMKRPVPQGALPTPPIIVVDDSKSVTHPTINGFTGTHTPNILQPQDNPVESAGEGETFLSDFDTNELLEYMAQLETLVEDATPSNGHQSWTSSSLPVHNITTWGTFK